MVDSGPENRRCPNRYCNQTDCTEFSTCRYCGTAYDTVAHELLEEQSSADGSRPTSAGSSMDLIKLAAISFTLIVVVALQYVMTQPPPGWQTTLAHVSQINGYFVDNTGLKATLNSMNRRNTLLVHSTVTYKFDVGGKQYQHTMRSFYLSFRWKALDPSQYNSLYIYYDPSDPDRSTAPSVGREFTQMTAMNYVVAAIAAALGFVIFPAMDASIGVRAPGVGDRIINMSAASWALCGFIVLYLAFMMSVDNFRVLLPHPVQDIKEASETLGKDASNYDALMKRAEAYQVGFNSSRAIADYTSAIAIRSGSAEAYQKRADVYEAMGDMDNARKDRETAARLNH